MSLTYALPDVHGRIDLLDAALARICAYQPAGDCTVVTLGDYVDRGGNSAAVVERLMTWQPGRFRLIALKGNHEAMMLEACLGLAAPDRWLRNGGDQTLRSYGSTAGDEIGIVPKRHLDWLAGLGLMHVDRHRIFAHAAVDPHLALDRQTEETLLWKCYRRGTDGGHGDRHVVHGHDARLEAPVIRRHRTNLDAGAWLTGRLIVGIFEDGRPGGAVDFLEILGC